MSCVFEATRSRCPRAAGVDPRVSYAPFYGMFARLFVLGPCAAWTIARMSSAHGTRMRITLCRPIHLAVSPEIRQLRGHFLLRALLARNREGIAQERGIVEAYAHQGATQNGDHEGVVRTRRESPIKEPQTKTGRDPQAEGKLK